MGRLKILIAHARPSIARGLALLFEDSGQFETVAVVPDVDQAVRVSGVSRPDLLAVDAALPGLDYRRVVQSVAAAAPGCSVVVLADADEPADMQRAIRAGVRGYLTTSAAPDELVRRLQVAAQGDLVVSGPLASEVQVHMEPAGGTDGPAIVQEEAGLSHREQEVLRLVAEGRTNPEIARTLQVTEHTVKAHVRSILRKLKLRNRQQVAAHAARQGLVDDVLFGEHAGALTPSPTE